MKNGLMEEGDVILHRINNTNRYQWIYCRKSTEINNTDEFAAGNFDAIVSPSRFDTEKDAIANLNEYINKYQLKKPNIIMKS